MESKYKERIPFHLITTDEFSKMCGLSRQAILARCRSRIERSLGFPRPFKIGNQGFKWREDECLTYVEKLNNGEHPGRRKAKVKKIEGWLSTNETLTYLDVTISVFNARVRKHRKFPYPRLIEGVNYYNQKSVMLFKPIWLKLEQQRLSSNPSDREIYSSKVRKESTMQEEKRKDIDKSDLLKELKEKHQAKKKDKNKPAIVDLFERLLIMGVIYQLKERNYNSAFPSDS